MYVFITLLAICLLVNALAADYAMSKERGWTPLVVTAKEELKKIFGRKDK